MRVSAAFALRTHEEAHFPPIGLFSNVTSKELRSMNHNTKLTLLVLSLVLLVPAISGQSFQASVSGIITDPAGAVVPNVKIAVMDTERGASFSTIANQDGVYVINNLIPGTYTITAEAP